MSDVPALDLPQITARREAFETEQTSTGPVFADAREGSDDTLTPYHGEHGYPEGEEPTVPAEGDRYVKRYAPDAGRIVTVTRVWAARDGHTAIAYRWHDPRASDTGSACPLGVFHHEHRAVHAGSPAAPRRPTASTITDDQLDRLHKQRDFFAHAAERAEAALDRVRDLAHRMRAGSPCGAAAVYAERIEQALDGREQQ
ncbi:hypothetical protein DEH18_33355 [Streptomyces sp. NHF165]|uniref:hypothetical protein n=1 Tax=Streptomyces sp. NHF165 TaxID=2175864 RepID=UPI00132F37D5|nr:hypothetical protein [Streptomyces sp. NHF165]QHF97919.1 hypothetical protein DEH18_33355 [Streptomyces sp. NHF165]